MENINKTKIQEIEVKILEQEHRLIPILKNVYFTFNKYKDNKLEKAAIYKSLVYKIFSPSTVIASGVGFVALLGLFVALRANYLFEEQNIKLDTQNYLMEAERRSSLMFELTSILEQIQKEISLTKKAIIKVEPRSNKGDEDEDEETKVSISKYTKGRIVALSRSLRPYRYLTLPRDAALAFSVGNEEDYYENIEIKNSFAHSILQGIGAIPVNTGPKLISKDMSPERGQLLLSLYNANIDLKDVISSSPDFSRSVLDGSILAYNDLSDIVLTGASIRGVDLTETDLSSSMIGGVDFTESELRGVNFTGCMCVNVKFRNIRNFSGAKFSDANDYIGSDFTKSNLDGIIVSNSNWLINAEKANLKIIGIEYSIWEIKEKEIEENIIFIISKKANKTHQL